MPIDDKETISRAPHLIPVSIRPGRVVYVGLLLGPEQTNSARVRTNGSETRPFVLGLNRLVPNRDLP